MLQVGQKLWWVPSARYGMSEQEVTVEKIGRKWATLSGGRYRIDIKTLRADGSNYCSPGTCYIDKEAFLIERETRLLWCKLRTSLTLQLPAGVTVSDIQQAMQLLKVPQTT